MTQFMGNSKFQGMPYVRMAPGLIEVVLVLMLAWLVAGWLIAPVASTLTTPASVRQAASGVPSVSVQTLLNMAPFGKPRTKVSGMEVKKIQRVMPSHRTMTLQGTVVSGNASVAMIVPRSGAKLEIFHIGDSILPGVVLKRVERKRVFIESGGRLEALMLAGVKQTGGMPVQFTSNAGSGNSRHVSRKILNRELNDFPKLLSQARVIPEIREGKNIGFRLSEIIPGSLYDRIGLKNGDIVQTVNGVRIQDPSQAMAMYQQLKDAPSVAVELLRNGQQQTLNYNIR